MNKIKAKVKGYAFVIMSNGMPRIDNPKLVPQDAWDKLTQEQKDFANENAPINFKRGT